MKKGPAIATAVFIILTIFFAIMELADRKSSSQPRYVIDQYGQKVRIVGGTGVPSGGGYAPQPSHDPRAAERQERAARYQRDYLEQRNRNMVESFEREKRRAQY